MEVSGRRLMNADLKKFNRLDRQRHREPLSSGKGVSGSTENKAHSHGIFTGSAWPLDRIHLNKLFRLDEKGN